MRALVTGASRGIGRAIALEIAPDCDALVLAARTQPLLKEVGHQVQRRNPKCRAVVQAIDVTDPQLVDRCFAEVIADLGGLDALINCAGTAIPATAVQEITLEVWEQIFKTNATAPFLMIKAAIPAMRHARNPTIINMSSTAGLSARPGWSAYAAAKASVANFSETMAAELKPYGIKVHCIAPGRTATELRRVLVPDEDPSTIMQPEAVARVVRFLLSVDGQVLQGQTIRIRGD